MFIRGSQSLKLSAKAAAFKRESFLNGGARLPLDPGPVSLASGLFQLVPQTLNNSPVYT